MRLTWVLVLLVLLTHYGHDPLAEVFYAGSGQASRALFYVGRGCAGVVLFGLVWALGWVLVHPLYRECFAAACLWGVVEEGETAVCRLARPIAEHQAVEIFSGLCGPLWYQLGLAAACGLALSIVLKQQPREVTPWQR